MKYFRILTSNKNGDFTIGEDELDKFMEAVKLGKAAIFRQGILANPNMAISVVPDKETNQLVEYEKTNDREFKELVSPFAKLLAGKLPTLSARSRTEVLEEVAFKERKEK